MSTEGSGVLTHLKFEKCPVCGSRIKEERRHSQHTSGAWNEAVRFDCGAVMQWSPNLMIKEIAFLCPKLAPMFEIGAVYHDLKMDRWWEAAGFALADESAFDRHLYVFRLVRHIGSTPAADMLVLSRGQFTAQERIGLDMKYRYRRDVGEEKTKRNGES